MKNNTHIIGKDTIRIDAEAKVKGLAKFGDDLRLFNPLYLKAVYAEYAHAEVLNIDKKEALKVPGVIGVFDTNDVPYEKMIGELFIDQYVFVDDKTRYLGDVICVVAAENQTIADFASKLIKVSYNPLTSLTDPKTAIDNEEIINKDYPRNICGEIRAMKGNTEEEFEKSDIIIEDHFETQFVEHAYLEPECVAVEISSMRDELTIYGSLQAPYNLRISISRMTGIPESQIIIKPSNIGGSFGGKIETAEAMACRAAIVALKTKRNVHYRLTREESIRESYKRHPIIFDMKLSSDKDGHLKALKVDSINDAGAYINMSVGVAYKTATLGPGPYKMNALDYDAKAVLTNNIHTGSMRGFGTPQAIFAMENMMDELAEKLDVSPLEIRRRNLLHNNDISPCGHKLDFMEVSVEECMNVCAKAIDYENKYNKIKEYNKTHKNKRGLGIAVAMRGGSIGADGNGFDVSRCLIEIEPDASVHFNIGLVELGQGLRTAQAMMCAEGLGCNFDRITIGETDTSRSPVTGACIASRGTLLGGGAIKNACDKIHAIIKEAIETNYNINISNIQFSNDKIIYNDNEISFKEAISICYKQNMSPVAAGTYQIPKTNWVPYKVELSQKEIEANPYYKKANLHFKEGMTGEPFYTYTFSCQMAEVEINTSTGESSVLKMVGAIDTGKTINPIMAKGQIYGGMVMAQGMGLTEDLGINRKDGSLKNLNYDTYIIPTFADVSSENEAFLVEHTDSRSAFGGHSLGEPGTETGAAAIACAVNMALGKAGYIKTLPYDIDKVYFACRYLGL
ncbi:MAG: xanthine dehydrogenase family protein [Lachnospiraceae bacterium]|nr:xanthine dehydrogenase family protein [Lachnospiraceae bacterium]